MAVIKDAHKKMLILSEEFKEDRQIICKEKTESYVWNFRINKKLRFLWKWFNLNL